MEAIIEKCCGLDVHQANVVACVLVSDGNKPAKKQVRKFRTVHRELLALADWLTELGITHVGMESTGIYWVPVFRALEGRFELVIGNAQHIKNVPGRKTDVRTVRNSLDRDHRNQSIAITETSPSRSPKTVHRDRWPDQ